MYAYIPHVPTLHFWKIKFLIEFSFHAYALGHHLDTFMENMIFEYEHLNGWVRRKGSYNKRSNLKVQIYPLKKEERLVRNVLIG
jgi:hypothetical protein